MTTPKTHTDENGFKYSSSQTERQMKRGDGSWDVKFYLATRCTRWDVYPTKEPAQVVAHGWSGYFAKADDGVWYKSPTSYVLSVEVTPEEALQLEGMFPSRTLPAPDVEAQLRNIRTGRAP